MNGDLLRVKGMNVRKILATNCKLTIELELEIEKGIVKSSVPMGTSTGKYEVKSFSADHILKIFLDIKKHFLDKEFRSQEEVDSKLKSIDGTQNFGLIGGNLALAISSSFLKAFALNDGKEVFEYFSGRRMPIPLANLTGGWGEESEVQEFSVFPEKPKSFKESVFRIADAYLDLGNTLKEEDKTFKFSKNYESAWVTNLSTRRILELLSDVCREYGLRIGMDFGAIDRWDGETYLGRSLEEHRQFISGLIEDFDVKFMEDPFQEDDFDSFAWLTKRFKNVIICGDDLYATNPERLRIGIEKKATNSILVKPNQIGTITDVIKVMEIAKKHKMIIVMSHRSGTTDETLLSHLAVGLGSDLVKYGISGERIIKINELMRIEEKI